MPLSFASSLTKPSPGVKRPHPKATPLRFCVICSVRNEGPFLVEWISWYRRLGFDDIVVVSNDCTDHSPALLDALDQAGWITHLRHDVPSGTNICAQKLEAAKNLPQVEQADWVLVCDVDEFLTIHQGAGQIRDLITPEADFLGMAINWRVFGTSGQTTWRDGLVHRQFIQAALPQDSSSSWIKCIHAHPGWFRRLGEHGPKRLAPRHARDWGKPGLRWVNVEGQEITDWQPEGDYLRRLQPHQVSHLCAQMNHYMIRSEESFNLKRGTPSAVAGKNRYTDSFFARFNRNEVEDRSALRHQPAFDAIHAECMALPQIPHLHHLCCADYVTRLTAKQGQDPQIDPRFLEHMSQAKAARP